MGIITKNSDSLALIYGLCTVVLWSTVATAFTIALEYLPPAQLLLIASVTSFLFLFFLLIIQKKVGELLLCFKQTWRVSLVFGAINPFVYYLVLLTAYDLLPAQEAQAINYTWAIMLSLLAVPILKQRFTYKDFFAAAFCYFGVLFIATKGHPFTLEFSNPKGVLMALLSTVIWALYWLLNAKDTRPSVIALTLNFMCAIPMVWLYCWFTDAQTSWPIEGVVGALYIGFF